MRVTFLPVFHGLQHDVFDFLLPAGCHGIVPVLNLLSASVAKKSIFSPLQEKLCVGSKNDLQFLECHDVVYQHAKFGGDRTTRAGCRSENLCFLCHAWSECA